MKISMCLLGTIGLVVLLSAAAYAGDLNASCTGGIIQAWNDTLSAEGNRIQLLWAGPDGKIDPPDSNALVLGAPTGDDEFIKDTYVGNGYLANYAQGRFDKLFSHGAIQPGRWVYLRAWDKVTITHPDTDSYGDSELYLVVKADEFESYDFPAFEIDMWLNGDTHPVELSSFSVSSVAGRIVITWTTQSESQNLGFHIYKSDSPTGQKVRANKEMIKGALNSATSHNYSWEEAATEDGKVWYFWLADVATDGTMRYFGPKRIETIAAPKYYSLEQNYPNPFNPTTTVTFALKDAGKVYLSIFNLRGQTVRELLNEEKEAGRYAVEWNGQDSNGFNVPSGLYFYTIRVNDFSVTKKMALTK